MHLPRLSALLAAVIALALVAGCAAKPYEVAFQDKGAALTGKAAEELAAGSDVGPLAKVKVSDAASMRSEVLEQLRAKGESGAKAATLLTEGFPPDTAAVPLLVRYSSVDGTSAVVVVEAFGDSGGTLVHRRLWVFAVQSGSVVRAASFR
jgi:hypothetical protein